MYNMPRTAPLRLLHLAKYPLQFIAMGAGAYFAGVYPAQLWADKRRATNFAAHHMPNMDPGVVVVIGLVVTAFVVVLLFVAELVRIVALQGKSLSPLAAVILGVLAAWPVGYAILESDSRLFIILSSALGICMFYYARHTLIVHAERRYQGAEHNNQR